MFYVYFLKSCKNSKIYVGYTEKKPEERLKDHNCGTNSFTKQNVPFELIYYEDYACKTDALRREKFYKSGFGRKIRDAIITAVSASCQRQMSLWIKRLIRLWRRLARMHGVHEVVGSSPATPTINYFLCFMSIF